MEHEKQVEALKQQAETERAEMKARIDAETKLTIAQMNAQAAEKPSTVVSLDADDKLHEIGESIKSMAGESSQVIGAVVGQLSDGATLIAQAAQQMTNAAAIMATPKTKRVSKLADGTFEMSELYADEKLHEISESIKSVAGESSQVVGAVVGQLADSATLIAQAAGQMTAAATLMATPKTKRVSKLADGSFEMSEV
jgi:tetrahydromethanopterin S-methyltransferase subunit G